MLMREICGPRGIWYSWVNKFSYFLNNTHAIDRCFIILNKTKKTHIHVKYCWKTYFTSIGTLSQTFKNHIHNKCCVPSASDVFLSKNDNSGRKTREASEGVEYDFRPVWSHVLIYTHYISCFKITFLLVFESM